jgi:hypothetical protein
MALVYGLLGDKAAVEQQAGRLQERITTDAYEGPASLSAVLSARAWLGEKDEVIVALDRLLRIPSAGSLTPALLRYDPLWFPLRGDPRFQKLAGMTQ